MEDEAWLRVGVAGALTKAYAEDQKHFLEALATMLERAMPGHVKVRRGGGLFARARPVREVSLQLGDHRYVLADPGHGSLRGQRILAKRGIDLRTEEVPVDAWIEEVASALQEHAR